MRFGLLLLGLCLLLVPLAGANSLLPVEGDLEYLQSAQIEGFVGAAGPSVVHSGASEDGLPTLRNFLLKAPQVNVVRVRSYESVGDDVGWDGNQLLPGTAQPPLQEDEEIFTQVDLRLIGITPEWNFLLSDAAPGASAVVRSLGAGAYELTNTNPHEQLVPSDAPRGPTLERYLAGADRTTSDQLRLETRFLALEAQGDFNLLLYGAQIRLIAEQGVRDFETGHHRVSEPGPLGVPVEQRVNDAVLLRIFDGTVRLLHEGPSLTLYANQFDVRGRIDFREASGTLAWEQEPRPVVEEALRLEGELALTARGAPRADSEGTQYAPIHVNGRALAVLPAPLPPDSATPLVVAAVGISVSALALRYVSGLRRAAFALIGLFSMLGKDDALKHQARSQLLDHVRSNPGTTLSAAQQDLSMGWGTIGYHVTVLERLGLLVTKRAGGKRLLFVQGHSRLADPLAWGVLDNPSVRTLLESHLLRGDAVTATTAALTLRRTAQYSGRLLRRMAEVGLLEVFGSPHRAAYRATPLLLDLAQRIERLPMVRAEIAGSSGATSVATAPPMAMASANPGALTLG